MIHCSKCDSVTEGIDGLCPDCWVTSVPQDERTGFLWSYVKQQDSAFRMAFIQKQADKINMEQQLDRRAK